jgi:hypothetical protein
MNLQNVTDFYQLSPMQQGMVIHALQDEVSGAYVEITTCVLVGEIDAVTIRQAWESVVARHNALRTAFLWEGLDEPIRSRLADEDPRRTGRGTGILYYCRACPWH